MVCRREAVFRKIKKIKNFEAFHLFIFVIIYERFRGEA